MWTDMKLQKVFVVLGISVCLIAAEMQATFGIGEESGQEEGLGTVEEAVSGEPGMAEEIQGTEGSFEQMQPVQAAEEPVQQPEEPAQPAEEPVQQPSGEMIQQPEEPVQSAEEGVQQPSGEIIRQPEEPDQQPTVEETQPGQAAEEPVQQPSGEIIRQPEEPDQQPTVEETQPGQAAKEPAQSAGEPGQPSGEPVQIPGVSGETEKNEPGMPADDDTLNNGTADEEELPKDDGTVGEEVPKDENDPGTEEVPGGADNPEEEVPKDENDPGTEEVPGEDDNPGEEVPKDENDPGAEEVPGGDSSSDDYSGIKDDDRVDDSSTKNSAGGSRHETSNEEQGDKAPQTAGDRSKPGNMFSSFAPSSEFIDDAEKVKYNVDVPVSGLPGFITQEMVIGALKCQDETGYPASVTIAQIIQESGFGKYGPDGDKGQGLSYLAYQYNNLFGIKGSGTAGSVAMNTGEQRQDGSRYNITAGFRVYNTYTECIDDRSSLLERVYKDLTFGVKDANTFAMKIGQRWATSLSYGQNLIQQMNRYDLYRLDEMTLDEFSGMIGVFANPCPGARLTSSFGYRTAPTAGASTYHKGIDMGTGAYHIPTYAASAGIVTYAGASGAAGNLVTIDHGNGLVTKYMHHDKVYVKPGDRVEKGQQIGLSGTTGNSTGNHLHFQVEKDGVEIDPLLYLDIQQ